MEFFFLKKFDNKLTIFRLILNRIQPMSALVNYSAEKKDEGVFHNWMKPKAPYRKASNLGREGKKTNS